VRIGPSWGVAAVLTVFASVGCHDASQNGSRDTPDSSGKFQRRISVNESDRQEWDKFFVDWLKGHNEANVVVDAGGVGLTGNATRLTASRYGVARR
jgi:hypothetical protein